MALKRKTKTWDDMNNLINRERKKILFVNRGSSDSISGGAAILTKRNLDSLLRICGNENVIVYNLVFETNPQESRWEKVCIWAKSILQGFRAGLTEQKRDSILQIIKHDKVDVIFLDSSLWGTLNKAIKKRFPQVKIITNFHNVEFQYAFCELKIAKKLFRLDILICTFLTERYAYKYSDKIITLNFRDANLVKRIYGRNTSTIIPISIHDTLDLAMSEPNTQTQSFTILFVGSLFYANIQGITWFVKEVMPVYPNVCLEIVGKNMHELKAQLERPNVKIHSSVPNLQEYYQHSDLVIMPIFTGGGMKLKTAEALMYGKTIIGTPEAFCGYDYRPEIGKICVNKTEFCDAIAYYLKHKPERFNGISRNLFLSKYSFDATLEQFRCLLLEEK
jgi:glycosyltransferase involved in cell wall biosynthesis